MFDEDELSEERLKNHNERMRCFFSSLLEVARTNCVTAYEKIYDLMGREKWIRRASTFPILSYYKVQKLTKDLKHYKTKTC